MVGGLPECIVDGDTGVLINSKDSIDFAQAVIKLLKEHDLRLKMGENANKWVKENFLIESIAPRYLNFYKAVLKRCKKL